MREVSIREATHKDHDFIVALMVQALAPYYGGDHRAHATRIFNTHIQGGVDKIGHFSFEQKIFILLDGEKKIGMLNLVGKKQGTYKISPIIISTQYQGKRGYGSTLLSFAEEYAHKHGVRQIYCTVAEKNSLALQFFLKKGYIIAGRSESHYKQGTTEVMLYKLFWDDAVERTYERRSISVIPMEDVHKEQVRDLILQNITKYFSGVDNNWVDALFTGYERRYIRDINVKYKLIFVATDRKKKIIGVVGATPKKGEPIKLMPCVASNPQAFLALISDIPQLLKEYGHKLYVHIVPSVDETIILQRMGWTLDAMMPAAYNNKYVTQQWGYNLGEDLMRTMRVKQHFFDLIVDGQKKLEARVGYHNIKQIQIGEKIKIATHKSEAMIKIKDIWKYPTIKSMLEREDYSLITPGISRSESIKP